jgi:hypothetical protein
VRKNDDHLMAVAGRHRPLSPAVLFVVGLVLAFLLQVIQAQAFGGNWTGLIGVGEASPLAPLVEAELGEVALWEDVGHDGQINYGIARDPTGSRLPVLIGEEGYRYRRILYPFLAGLGGLLPPRATLVGLMTWSAVGFGLAAAGLALIADALGTARFIWLAAALNPGLWLATQLLMVDALGFGLATLGLGLWLKGIVPLSLAMFALAALAKDQYALVGMVVALIELARGRLKSSLRVGLVTILPLLVWATIVTVRLGGGLSPEANFDWPLVGILGSAGSVWPAVASKDVFYTVAALAGVLTAVIGGLATNHALLRWLAWSWAALALVGSSGVWDFGNNAARAYAPALTFGLLALFHGRAERRYNPASTEPSLEPLGRD